MMDQAWIGSHGYPNYDLLHDPSSLQTLVTGNYPNPNPHHAPGMQYMMSEVGDHLEASTSLAFNNYSSVLQDQNTIPNNNNNSSGIKINYNNNSSVLLPISANNNNNNHNKISTAVSERISSPSPYRTQLQRESHILAERQRREEMNEKFTILRSMIPKLTKKDKASIVNDTINYVKELEKKVAYLLACKGKKKRCHTQITKKGIVDAPLLGAHIHSPLLMNQTETMVQGNKKSFMENTSHDSSTLNGMQQQTKSQLNEYNEFPRRVTQGQVEIEELGSQAVIKVITSRSRGVVLRIHLTLEDYKLDVIQSNVTTLGNNMVHFITIGVKSSSMINMDALATSLQSAITMPINEP